MKEKIQWLDSWISVVLKLNDLSISYSYSERRDEFEHKCSDHIEIIGEIVFSDYKNLKKDDPIKLLSIVNHDNEIETLDKVINPWTDKGDFRGITIRKWREEQNTYKCVGSLDRDMNFLTTDDRFWQRYALMKLQGKDIYLALSCKREKRRKPMVWSYSLETKFDPSDYE